MVQIWKHVPRRLPELRELLLIALAGALAAAPASTRKFYSDDPLCREPEPLPVARADPREINEQFEFFRNTFAEPGKAERDERTVPRARNVNTVDEVPDSAWYTNRKGSPDSIPHQRMSLVDLVRGPGESRQPSTDGPWTVLSAKTTGITPGFLIRDRTGGKFVLKLDPRSNPEMASAADVIGSKFFYALGYNVPENHIVEFTRDRIQITAGSRYKDKYGHERAMTRGDVDDLLRQTRRENDGRYRAMASAFLEGQVLGPFRFTGTRSDDPNDLVRHENRRELRGLYVFAAWLNHTDAKSGNTLDTLVSMDGLRFIRHYLVDFGATLGSATLEPKNPADGRQYMFNIKPAVLQFFTLGLAVPSWERLDYPDAPAIGRFAPGAFDPDSWKPNYPNVAFDLRLPDDTFWAAKRVMAFTDEDIRALVNTGQYSDPKAAEWIAGTLIWRRDAIGRAFFEKVLPLDDFRVRGGRLEFDDLAARYRLAAPHNYELRWSRFDNTAGRKEPLSGSTGAAIPARVRTAPAGSYFAVDIAGDRRKSVTVYLRASRGGMELAGIDRMW